MQRSEGTKVTGMVAHWGDHTEIAHRGQEMRVQTIAIVKIYRVQPLDPTKTRHGHRICTVLGFKFKEEGKTDVIALVRFHDTRHLGQVELEDLVVCDMPGTP